jgi:glycosyltransferase involved in cell wall biosynthesis
MENVQSSSGVKTIPADQIRSLLVVGPLPPPIGGAPATVKEILDELVKDPYYKISVINSSPATDPREQVEGFNFEKAYRFIKLIFAFYRQLLNNEAVLIFANNLFAFVILPFLLIPSKLFRKPFFVKPIGGDLDVWLDSQSQPLRSYFTFLLSSVDGILSQTRLLQRSLQKYGCKNVFYLPGCRTAAEKKSSAQKPLDKFKIIFLAHINKEKGALILLQALQKLSALTDAKFRCDFYGPVQKLVEKDFFQLVSETPNAEYCGVVEVGSGVQLIANYDALVLPTFFDHEGHPGVLIEAMHASVPVISTFHRAIPELVTDGENGLLVPINDSEALAQAIKLIVEDRELCLKLGRANHERGKEFRTNVVVSKLKEFIFPSEEGMVRS